MKKRGRGRVVSEPDFDHGLAGSDLIGDKILLKRKENYHVRNPSNVLNEVLNYMLVDHR